MDRINITADPSTMNLEQLGRLYGELRTAMLAVDSIRDKLYCECDRHLDYLREVADPPPGFSPQVDDVKNAVDELDRLGCRWRESFHDFEIEEIESFLGVRT